MSLTAAGPVVDERSKANPEEVYRTRREARASVLQGLKQREERVANARMGLFAGAAVLGWLTVSGHLGFGWMGLPFVGFIALVTWHSRLQRAIRKAERAVAFYDRGLARLDDRWVGLGENGARFADETHPFASDLDLFGPASLFERMNTARTVSGETTLASWLKKPIRTAAGIERCQVAVAELALKLDLREELDLLGDDVRMGLDPQKLIEWGSSPAFLPGRIFDVIAHLLAIAGATTLIGWFFLDWGIVPLIVVALVEVAFWAIIRKRTSLVTEPVEARAGELQLLSSLLLRIETEEFDSPALREVKEVLVAVGEPPSRQIARIARLVRRLESTKNQLVAPFAALLMSGTRLAYRIEAWRLRSGPEIARWIAGVGSIEAFSSIGAYAFELPDDPFPTLIDSPAIYDAKGLGHPLIAQGKNVRNDITLGETLRLLVVSGSNMSGKSTMLRSVGINGVLAMIGAPVRAESMRLAPFLIGATLRVQDSLQTGTSRFYAELKRLRQVVDLAGGTPPLLFLIDEIFSGTNSDDRRVGAEGVVKGLVERGAIGLVTTHDLALARIADSLGSAAMNVHFSDRFEEGSLQFDYVMKPGIVQHSNALALMRAVGLDV